MSINSDIVQNGFYPTVVQRRLQHSFMDNRLSVSKKQGFITVENSHNQKEADIIKIVESSGFCPLI
ncbi:MAG: hypothetical protein H0U49_04010 [Parachlamydiaceae bacterium]|nr:hypothetical protein [Parachlamydiaceae bacterium]